VDRSKASDSKITTRKLAPKLGSSATMKEKFLTIQGKRKREGKKNQRRNRRELAKKYVFAVRNRTDPEGRKNHFAQLRGKEWEGRGQGTKP